MQPPVGWVQLSPQVKPMELFSAEYSVLGTAPPETTTQLSVYYTAVSVKEWILSGL